MQEFLSGKCHVDIPNWRIRMKAVERGQIIMKMGYKQAESEERNSYEEVA